MTRLDRLVRGIALIGASLLAVASSVRAGTVYVANNGVDGPTCGPKASPCRSITQGITNAVAGDKILVGPGRYSAATGESGAPGCDCLVAVNKPVSFESTNGAAETVIDGSGFLVGGTVLIIATGGAFGKPGKGFLVQQSAGGNHQGIVIDADDFTVRGNQFIPVSATAIGIGVEMVDSPGAITFEGNQVVGWSMGILMRGANKTVRKNVVTDSGTGISVSAGSVAEGNVVVGCIEGILLGTGSAMVTGNALIRNSRGITNQFAGPPGNGNAFTGTVTKNNLIANGCGLNNDGIVGFPAGGNYWGAPTGPGPAPANDVCNSSGGTTVATPFAGVAFKVKPAIKP